MTPFLLAAVLTVGTFAGPSDGGGYADGDSSVARFSAPEGIAACLSGDLFVADTGNEVIRRIRGGVVTTFAAVAARDLVADADCTLFASDGERLRVITAAGEVSILAAISGIGDLAIGLDGNVYVTVTAANEIRRITRAGHVSPFAALSNPDSITADRGGNFFVSESGTGAIRKVSSGGTVTTFIPRDAGRSSKLDLSHGSDGKLYWTDRELFTIQRYGTAVETVLSTGLLSSPSAMAFSADGTIVFTEAGAHRVRSLLVDGSVRTVAGIAPLPGIQDGVASDARFTFPSSVGFGPDGTLYVGESGGIRKITPDARVTLMASGVPAGYLAVDANGNVYTSQFFGHVVRKVTPDGTVSIVAGKINEIGFVDGPTGTSRLRHPRGLVVGRDGNLYIADAGNAALRRMTPSGHLTTVDASFSVPMNLILDEDENIYYATEGPNRLMKRSPSGEKTVVVTLPRMGGEPRIARASDGSFYFIDLAVNSIWRLALAGAVERVAGRDHGPGNVNGIGEEARFALPRMLTFGPDGRLYIADSMNHAIRVIDFSEPHGPRRRAVRH